MANLKTMQAYANKCAEKWQTSDCKLGKWANAHCHILDGEYPRGVICLHHRRIPAKSTKGWHYTIAHEVAHLAVKSNHSTATFARRMVALGIASDYDKDSIRRAKAYANIK
ncbi:hypothetical protein LCGC14_0420600 [marine sediment metagenome]|uniref:SprT-like domain-containing protein n=1 Tax=marine sediment metagenome TaxID=412755 RepID=A0A0F9VD40_9ZZZZ